MWILKSIIMLFGNNLLFKLGLFKIKSIWWRQKILELKN